MKKIFAATVCLLLVLLSGCNGGETPKETEPEEKAFRFTENYYAYVNRANYYFRTGEYDAAASDAKQALAYKNNGMEAASLLTILCALQGDEENKKRYYHIALTAGQDPRKLNQAIAYYLNEADA